MKKISLFMAVWVMIVMTCFAQSEDSQKIKARLVTQEIVCNGENTKQEIISYNNTTYVPLRVLGEMLGVSVSYKDKCLTVGGAGSSTAKKSLVSNKYTNKHINAVACAVRYEGENIQGGTSAIMYEGTTYISIRIFGDLVHTKVEFKQGIIYIGAVDQTIKDRYHSNNTNTPVPVGKAQTVTTHNTGTNCTAEVCVEEVYRGEDALEMLGELKSYQQPNEGQEYVVAKISVEITNVDSNGHVSFSSAGGGISRSNYLISTNDFTSYDSNNKAIPFPSVTPPAPYLSGTLTNGSVLEGWAVFTVNIADKNPKILFGENKKDGTGGTWFSIAE